MLQCVVVCCSVSRCVAVCCRKDEVFWSLSTFTWSLLMCISLLWVSFGGDWFLSMRSTLKHTATRCNTLQHAATHCNAMQHTATHFIESLLVWSGFYWCVAQPIVFGVSFFSISNLNCCSSSLGLFCHLPLKRGPGDWDWRMRMNDTPNAIGCTWYSTELMKKWHSKRALKKRRYPAKETVDFEMLYQHQPMRQRFLDRKMRSFDRVPEFKLTLL